MEEIFIFIFFASGYQLDIASGIGMRQVFTSFSSRTPSRTDPTGPVHAVFLSVSSCVLHPVLFRRLCFFGIHYHHQLLTLCLPPLLQASLNPEAMMMETSHLGMSVLRSLLSLYIVWLWVSTLVPICCRKKLLWLWLGKKLTYEYSRMSLVIILLIHSLCRTEVLVFPLSVLGQPSSIRYGLHLMEWALSQIKLVDYSHRLCDTIALAYLQAGQHCRSESL